MNKFRVWCKNSKKYKNDNMFLSNCGELFKQMKDGSFEKLSKSGYIVERYTGLRDKNGVEIYEGDLVEYGYTYKNGYIVWFQNAWCIKHADEEHPQDAWYFVTHKKRNLVEVIGNIHDGRVL